MTCSQKSRVSVVRLLREAAPYHAEQDSVRNGTPDQDPVVALESQ